MHLAMALFVFVVLPWRFAEADKLSLPQECLQEYKRVVAKYGDEKGHCYRLQLIVNCFSRRSSSSETGPVVDHMRYLFTQESLFVNKLNICDINMDVLKEITDKTEDDQWDACAGEVHKTCIKQYLALMSKDGKVCNDADAWVACYAVEAEKQGCNAKILQHFTNMLKVVGRIVVKDIRRHMGVECSKTEL